MVDGALAALFSDMWRPRHTQAHSAVCASTRSRPADRPWGLAVRGPGSTCRHERLSAAAAVSSRARTVAYRAMVWCKSLSLRNTVLNSHQIYPNEHNNLSVCIEVVSHKSNIAR